jgi:hypothetical protein
MNIDDIFDLDNTGRSQEEIHASLNSYAGASISSSPYPSFLNPHASEFGFAPYGMLHESNEFSRPISSYVGQESDKSLYQSQALPHDSVNDHIGYHPKSPYFPSTFRKNSVAPQSQDCFDEYGSRIHQQPSKQFSNPYLSLPSTDSSGFNPSGHFHGGAPLRNRTAENGLPKTSSFKGHSNNGPSRSLASFSNPSYQSQFDFAMDPDLSLSSFGAEVRGYSPIRTPTSLSSASMSSIQYSAPTLSVGPIPPSSSAIGAAKTGPKDQRRSGASIDGFIYQVQFKRAHRHFVIAPSAPRDIIPGDFVKVEADRGEDMGIVLAKIPADSFEEVIPTAGYRGRGFSSGQGERKFLYRRATADEQTALALKVADEEKALETIREKSKERALPMKVLDAEYQFDRHKLTFYFEADKRIDFRDLVSELFSQYKTRIWMQQVDTSSLHAHDPGMELARATGFLPPRDDELAGYGRTSSFGSATTLTTLDTHDTIHHSISKSSEKPLAAPAVASTSRPSALFSSPSTAGLLNDSWGNYRF